MSLLEKLKHERDACVERYKRLERNLEVCKRELEQCDAEWGDFNVAIAALTPTPDFEAEKETAREQLEREPEIPEEGLGSSLIEMGYGDDDTPTEHISILTGDPAIEPEAGLHGENPVVIKPYRVTRDFDYEKTVEFFATMEEAAALYDDMSGKPHHGIWLSVLHEGENGEQEWVCHKAELRTRPALNEAMQDEREEGYAPVTNPEAHIQAVEAERFAQPTNPDADAIARAHDWYDPKAVAERNKFNPFSLFRAKEDA